MPDKQQEILHIQHHALRGGTEKYARELAQYMPQQHHYMLTTRADEWLIEDLDPEADKHYRFTADESGHLLGSLCDWLAIDLIHIHHLLGDHQRLLNALQLTGIAYGITLHDHYLACPTIKLINAEGQYCHDQTDISICQQCLSKQADLADINISDWRQQHQQLLSKACFITTPSPWASHSYQDWFPQLSFTTIPHGTVPASTVGKAIRTFLLPEDGIVPIGILGAMSEAKGEQRLQRLIERGRQRELPLRWVMIGYTHEHQQGWQSDDFSLTIHGSYDTNQINSLLDYYRIPWVFFPGIAPETFCYTLTDAWQAGRPVLVPPIGALKERVETEGGGWILDDWLDDDRVLDQLMAINNSRFSRELEQQTSLVSHYQAVPVEQAIASMSKLYQRAPLPQPTHIQVLSSKQIMDAAKRARLPTDSQQDWEMQHPAFIRYRAIIKLLNGGTGSRLRQCIPASIRLWLRRHVLGT